MWMVREWWEGVHYLTLQATSRHMLSISTVTQSTSFSEGSRSFWICDFVTMSNARSGVKSPIRTPGGKRNKIKISKTHAGGISRGSAGGVRGAGVGQS